MGIMTSWKAKADFSGAEPLVTPKVRIEKAVNTVNKSARIFRSAITYNHGRNLLAVESELVTVFVNGEPRQVPSESTVAALLAWLKLPSERVAVELNRSIVRKRDWQETPIAGGAEVEIVEFVGGG